jgi:hypothetical protein
MKNAFAFEEAVQKGRGIVEYIIDSVIPGLAKQPKNPETGFRKKQDTASKGLGIYS